MESRARENRLAASPDDVDAVATRAPVHYRLTKTPEELAAEAALEAHEEDYTPFVLAAANAALVLFLTLAISAMIVGHNLGAVVEVRFWWRAIPYIAFVAPRATFVDIISWSTAIAVGATCVSALVALRRLRHDRQKLYGWATGLFMAGLLVIFQFVRHLMTPPVVDSWISAQATAFIVVTALIFVGFKPGASLPEPTDPSKDGAAKASNDRSSATRASQKQRDLTPSERLKSAHQSKSFSRVQERSGLK